MKNRLISVFLALTLTTAIFLPLGNAAAANEKKEKPKSPVLEETDDLGQEYVNKIVFLGDSLTYGLKSYKILKDGKKTKQVWTPANGTFTLSYQSYITIVYPVTGKEITIRDAVKAAKPEMMVINLGLNGISFMKEDYFKSEYKDLVTSIQKLSPDTKIILQSIYPIAASYKSQKSINNVKIKAANKWIQTIAEETGVKYLDTYSALVGKDGWLPKKLQNGDGLHLNETGYAIVIDNLRTHGYK